MPRLPRAECLRRHRLPPHHHAGIQNASKETAGTDCIDGDEQLARYLELLNRDPLLTTNGEVRGIFAAQEIKPQDRVLAEDRGIACAVVDYNALRGLDDPTTGTVSPPPGI